MNVKQDFFAILLAVIGASAGSSAVTNLPPVAKDRKKQLFIKLTKN
jgi:hypothetical protein